MKDCTYYDLLGVPMDADEKEIADAKNFLVKKMHPDANVNCSFDTTSYIQNVLTAYRILSDPNSPCSPANLARRRVSFPFPIVASI